MPRVPPPKHTRFQPGQSGNKSGRPKLSPDLRAINELTVDEIKRTIAKHFRMTKEQLDIVLDDPKACTLDLVIASTIARAIRDGDISRAEYLFLRSLGRVKDVIEVAQPEPVVIHRFNGEKVEIGVKVEDET